MRICSEICNPEYNLNKIGGNDICIMLSDTKIENLELLKSVCKWKWEVDIDTDIIISVCDTSCEEYLLIIDNGLIITEEYINSKNDEYISELIDFIHKYIC